MTPNVIDISHHNTIHDFAYKTRGLTYARLSSIVSYDAESGLLYWRIRMGPRKAGSIAGHKNTSNRYVYIGIDGQIYLAHILIWFLETHRWPNDEIDHRDCDGYNNRWKNLREANDVQNCANRPKRSDSMQPYKSVRKEGQKWRAFIQKNGKRVSLGYFSTAEDASMAYANAMKAMHGEFARVI